METLECERCAEYAIVRVNRPPVNTVNETDDTGVAVYFRATI